MQHWRFSRVMFSLIAVLVMAVSLNVLGCSDDGDDDDGGEQDITAGELANRSFTIPDAGVIDPAFAGQQAVLAFGDAAGNLVTFTITGLEDDQNNPVGMAGNAVVASVEFFLTQIVVNEQLADSVIIGGKTFVTSLTTRAFILDITIELDENGNVIIRIANPVTGVVVRFVFRPGDTGATGTTGTGGE
jgi:hypothetical protein